MELPTELKAQLAEQKKQCIFCKIISKQTPANIIFEDSKTLALLDIYPAVKGHTLYLLKEHYPILPYLSEEELAHYFGVLPLLVKSIKSAVVATAFNIFIANGGAAGQNSPHLTIHLLPREEGDGFFNFLFHKKQKPLPEDKRKPLTPNIQYLMQKFQQENSLTINTSEYLPSYLEKPVKESLILYQDEKIIILLPPLSLAAGHIEIYSKLEEKNFEKLSSEDSIYLFHAASSIASLLFQLLQLHGTNIILKSGYTDDNKEGKLSLHIIPRMQNDSLQSLIWTPQQPKYKIESIAEKIKDKTWNLKYHPKKKEQKTDKNSPQNKEEKTEPKEPAEKKETKEWSKEETKSSFSTFKEEITHAISKLQK
ncbi:HIT domain-containing protein [Candidatus Woesearchaeota archaeon]|nr:HIT domain-containing protein [Candidatus Woesearchaeota archaeon]